MDNRNAGAAYAPGPGARMIPGAYDRTALTRREPGSMGGLPFGGANSPFPSGTMSDATTAEREREGGGSPRERRTALASG